MNENFDNLNNTNPTSEDCEINEAPIQSENTAEPSHEPKSAPRPETYVASEQCSYGGFSQKWAYDKVEVKSKKGGNAMKFFAVVMTALFIITALGFLFYFLSDKYGFFSSKALKEESKATDESYHAITPSDDEEPSGGNDSDSAPANTPINDEIYNAPARIPESVSDEYTGEPLSRQQLIKFATKSVVGIKTQVESYSYFGTSVYEGVGSGFVITETGYIVTNYHVIEDAKAIKVILSNGNEYDAELIGGDALSDLAVLRIEPKEELSIAVIGNSDNVVAGDEVIAIGCPAGIEFAGTATSGMVSMANRELSITDSYGRVQKTMYVIQIDAPINPGNSGGPLLNNRGEVIGVNTLKLSSTGYEGMGFALPINGVIDIVNEICENGEVVNRPESSYVKGRAALGISYDDISEDEAEYYKVPRGVLVVFATPDGAAQKYGIKSGDIITKFNSEEITDSTQLIAALAKCNPGDKVTVELWRDNETLSIDVVLTEAAQ